MLSEKTKEYNRKWYQRNKARRRASNNVSRNRIREWFAEYRKPLKCTRCPESHPACLDFHHRNSDEKDIEVSNMASQGFSKQRILEEISKCDVICSNCRRKHHFTGS